MKQEETDINDINSNTSNQTKLHKTMRKIFSDKSEDLMIKNSDGEVLWSWSGEFSGDRFGTAVSSAGDVNNDGRFDSSDLVAVFRKN